eukprot:8668679-Karenia_brevis.AAC.1
MGDWNNLAKGEVAHYVDPLRQGDCTAKCHNPVKGKYRNNPDFDDLPDNDGVRVMFVRPPLTWVRTEDYMR